MIYSNAIAASSGRRALGRDRTSIWPKRYAFYAQFHKETLGRAV